MIVEIAISSLLVALFVDKIGGRNSDTKKKITFLRRAARTLYTMDEEHFEGGCGDNVIVLKLLADVVGMPGVQIKAGSARSLSIEDFTSPADLDTEWPYPHAWLEVDGTVYDPTYDVLRLKGGHYEENMATLDALVSLDEVCEGNTQRSVEELLRELAPKRELRRLERAEDPEQRRVRLITGEDLEFERRRDVAFDALAEAQRGEPEEAMLRIARHPLGSGLYQSTAEHVGDLIHRMSQKPEWFQGGYEWVSEKVDKTLRWMTHDYGFEREVREQLRSNYRYAQERRPEELGGRSYEELETGFMALCRSYANAHRALTPYNRVQRLANRAAIALGEWRFHETISCLRALKDILDHGHEAWEKAALDPGKLSASQ
jgi:hypothetical protein